MKPKAKNPAQPPEPPADCEVITLCQDTEALGSAAEDAHQATSTRPNQKSHHHLQHGERPRLRVLPHAGQLPLAGGTSHAHLQELVSWPPSWTPGKSPRNTVPAPMHALGAKEAPGYP